MGFFRLLLRGQLRRAFSGLGARMEEFNERHDQEAQARDLEFMDNRNALIRLSNAQAYREAGALRDAIMMLEPALSSRSYTHLSAVAVRAIKKEMGRAVELAMASEDAALQFYGIAAAWRTLPVLDEKSADRLHGLRGGEPLFYQACMALVSLDEMEMPGKKEMDLVALLIGENCVLLRKAGRKDMASALEQRFADYKNQLAEDASHGFFLPPSKSNLAEGSKTGFLLDYDAGA